MQLPYSAASSKVYDEAFFTLLLDLVEICDSFDQLSKMARIANILYSPGEREFYRLHDAIRSTYTHLRGFRGIGSEKRVAKVSGSANVCGYCHAAHEIFEGCING